VGAKKMMWIGLLILGCGSEPPPQEAEEEVKKKISCLDACWLHFKDPRTSPIEVREYFDIYSWPKYEDCIQTALAMNQTPFEANCRVLAVGNCNLYCLEESNKNGKMFEDYEVKVQ
jgi:hypothetical protein